MTSKAEPAPRHRYTAAFAVARLSYDLAKKEVSDSMLAALYKKDHKYNQISAWVIGSACNAVLLVGAVFDVLDLREYALATDTPATRGVELNRANLMLSVVNMIEAIGVKSYLQFVDGDAYPRLNDLCLTTWRVSLENVALTEADVKRWMTDST
jgi:hypothetical protein